uniref:protein S-acyltransferase n=1 Tax=Anas zonorhyncha TaxID=75864 RepID=A0A8B9U3B2_9AVES
MQQIGGRLWLSISDSSLCKNEIKPQSHYNHGYSESLGRKSHIDDYSTWDIVKATQYGIYERCRELVEAGYDVRQPDKENVTLLHWAAINNRIDLVKYYISKGAIVDQLGGDLNSTPLHWATRQGHLSMVVQLMKYGADPSLIDGEGCSCIHLAAQFGHTSIVAYLIAKGQDVDMMDQNGMTPLMWAAYRTHSVDPTRLLLTFNVSVNLGDKYHKNTALHWAVLAGNTTVISLLLEAGANVDAQNIKVKYLAAPVDRLGGQFLGVSWPSSGRDAQLDPKTTSGFTWEINSQRELLVHRRGPSDGGLSHFSSLHEWFV